MDSSFREYASSSTRKGDSTFKEGKVTTNTIIFSSNNPSVEVLRLSKDGIWANPDVPADDVAKLVLEAIDYNIKVLVQKAVEDEREACAKVCEGVQDCGPENGCCPTYWNESLERAAAAIRARGSHD